jgi:hypothetical protein
MSSRFSRVWDSIVVGSFFGSVAGLLALVTVILYTIIMRPSSGGASLKMIVALHAGYLLVYVLDAIVIVYLWPIRRTVAGRWGLWFLATAAGALSVNSVAYGAPWNWSPLHWGYYVLVSVLFVPVFAWEGRRLKAHGNGPA